MSIEHQTFQTLPLSIELRKGDLRSGTDPEGKKWSVPMKADYGYVRGTKGIDGDHCDVYVGGNEEATHVFAIDQLKMPECKELDEQKFMIGFDSEKDAVATYLKHYPTKKILGPVKTMTIEDFVTKMNDKTLQGKKIAMTEKLQKLAFGSDPLRVVSDSAIGGLVGELSGRATGAVLGKYPGQSRDYGRKGGLMAGAGTSIMSADPQMKIVRALAPLGKELTEAMAIGKMDAESGGRIALKAIGRAAAHYAPEAGAGALGAAMFARSKPRKKIAMSHLEKLSLHSLEYSKLSEREKFELELSHPKTAAAAGNAALNQLHTSIQEKRAAATTTMNVVVGEQTKKAAFADKYLGTEDLTEPEKVSAFNAYTEKRAATTEVIRASQIQVRPSSDSRRAAARQSRKAGERRTNPFLRDAATKTKKLTSAKALGLTLAAGAGTALIGKGILNHQRLKRIDAKADRRRSASKEKKAGLGAVLKAGKNFIAGGARKGAKAVAGARPRAPMTGSPTQVASALKAKAAPAAAAAAAAATSTAKAAPAGAGGAAKKYFTKSNIAKGTAVGAAGVGLYGAKKAIDGASSMVQAHETPWQRRSAYGPGRVF